MKLFVIRRSLPILIGIIVVLGAFLGCLGEQMSRKIENTYSPLLPVVVIDAGHGGIDAGVRGISTGVKESDVNLEIAQFLRGFFVSAGFRCVMTRTTTGGLYGVFSKGFKMRDMQKRKEIILGANANLVVSVHQNFCPLPSRRGAQVFYNGEREGGKALADCIQGSLNDMDECVKKTSALAGDYYMLKCTSAPSVIVECGFLSNADDERLLITKTYQKAVAYAIFAGVLKFFA